MHCNDHSAAGRVAANAAEAGSGTLDRSQLLSAQEVQLVRQTLFNPLRGMTPQRVVGWLDNVESGFLSDALKAWELMASRDPVIRAVRGKRQSAVTQHSWSILETSAVTDDPSLANDADEQSKALKYFWNNIRVVNALDRNETGGFAKFARFATDPDSFKYGGFHFIWRPGPKGITATLEYVPGYLFENTSGELRFTGVNPSTVYGTELDPTNWLPMAGEGLMSAGSISYSLKHSALNAWVKYCNRFGMPFPVGKVNGGSSSKEWADMRATIRGIQNDNGAVINATSALELLEAGGNGVAPSETLIKLIDQDLMALWRGGDAGTRSRDGSDGNGVSLQAKEAMLIEAGDCAAVSEVMQAIDRLVLAWHFGANVEPLVYSQVNGPSMVDVMERMKVDEFLIGKGARISLSSLMEVYGREEAEPDEEVAGQAATTKPSVAANAFDPEKHPRDISGKFAETGASSKGSEAVKGKMRPGTDEDRKRFGIAPAFTNIQVTDDPKADLLWTAQDAKGRRKYGYSEAYSQSQAAAKFARIGALHKAMPSLLARINEDIAAGGEDLHQALTLRLIMKTGLRNGGDSGGGDVKAYGASSLLSSHARVEGDRVHLDFIGKEGIRQRHSFSDKILARHITMRQRFGNETLFDGDAGKTLEYMRTISGDQFKVHDLRTWYGTTAADVVTSKLVARGETPKTVKELKAFKKRVASVVARDLGNGASMALNNYIHPLVFAGVEISLGGSTR